MKQCKVKDCETESRIWGMCVKHYARKKRYGTTERLTGKPNRINVKKTHAEIILFGSKKALIDLSDVDKVKDKVWSTNSYLHVTAQKYKISLHRFLTNCPKGKVVDHINGDVLDNRRENMRICSIAENVRNSKISRNNTSKFKGVYWSKHAGKWVSRIQFNRRHIYLGYFSDKKEAALAYNKAARKYFGEYARLNNVPSARWGG